MRKIAGWAIGALVAVTFITTFVGRMRAEKAPPVATAPVQAAVPTPAPGGACVVEAPRHFKDPDSVKINGIEPVGTTGPNGGALYVLHINAKNSYGGYTGETAYFCELGAGEAQVLSFQEVGPRG